MILLAFNLYSAQVYFFACFATGTHFEQPVNVRRIDQRIAYEHNRPCKRPQIGSIGSTFIFHAVIVCQLVGRINFVTVHSSVQE